MENQTINTINTTLATGLAAEKFRSFFAEGNEVTSKEFDVFLATFNKKELSEFHLHEGVRMHYSFEVLELIIVKPDCILVRTNCHGYESGKKERSVAHFLILMNKLFSLPVMFVGGNCCGNMSNFLVWNVAPELKWICDCSAPIEENTLGFPKGFVVNAVDRDWSKRNLWWEDLHQKTWQELMDIHRLDIIESYAQQYEKYMEDHLKAPEREKKNLQEQLQKELLVKGFLPE